MRKAQAWFNACSRVAVAVVVVVSATATATAAVVVVVTFGVTIGVVVAAVVGLALTHHHNSVRDHRRTASAITPEWDNTPKTNIK